MAGNGHHLQIDHGQRLRLLAGDKGEAAVAAAGPRGAGGERGKNQQGSAG